jgi:5-methylcytosine-specific restriction endonuclease McrA
MTDVVTPLNRKRIRKGGRRRLFNHTPFCNYCRAPLTFEDATADHVVPLSRGGRNRRSNTVIACRSCNSEKGSEIWIPETRRGKKILLHALTSGRLKL